MTKAKHVYHKTMLLNSINRSSQNKTKWQRCKKTQDYNFSAIMKYDCDN